MPAASRHPDYRRTEQLEEDIYGHAMTPETQAIERADRGVRNILAGNERVIAAEWHTMFLPWFRQAWQPGQHIALIGPTGEGKSTFAGGILDTRKWVLALDPKGGDETLSRTGYKKLEKWPPPGRDRDRIAEGKPMRYIIGRQARTEAEEKAHTALMRQAVIGCWSEGGWTINVDEFQLLADRRMMGLDKDIERLLVAARSKGTSVVTSFQAPSWVPKASTRQATWVVMWPTRERKMIQVVADSMGRPWKELAAAVDELPPYHVLVIPKQVRAPYVLTHAPKLGMAPPAGPGNRRASGRPGPRRDRQTTAPR